MTGLWFHTSILVYFFNLILWFLSAVSFYPRIFWLIASNLWKSFCSKDWSRSKKQVVRLGFTSVLRALAESRKGNASFKIPFFFFSMLKWDFVFGTLPFFNYTNKFSAITFSWLNFQLLMTMWFGIIQFCVLFLEALVILLINAFYHKETRLCLSWNHVIRKHFSEVMLAFFKVYLYNSLFQPSLFFLLEHATSLFHTMYIFLDFFPSAPLTQFPYSSPTRHI